MSNLESKYGQIGANWDKFGLFKISFYTYWLGDYFPLITVIALLIQIFSKRKKEVFISSCQPETGYWILLFL